MDAIMIVQRRTRLEIERLAEMVRAVVGLQPNDRVSMTTVLEHVMPVLLGDEGYAFVVRADKDMIGAEALTHQAKPVIYFKDSSYESLVQGDPRARFTAAHELGHAMLHSGAHVKYARQATYKSDEVNPEWQADCFAAAFLMPEKAFRECTTIEEAQSKFGVGFRSAMWRAKILRHKWRRSRINQKKGSRHMPTPFR